MKIRTRTHSGSTTESIPTPREELSLEEKVEKTVREARAWLKEGARDEIAYRELMKKATDQSGAMICEPGGIDKVQKLWKVIGVVKSAHAGTLSSPTKV